MTSQDVAGSGAVAITTEDLREHYQGHRRLTRRVIEAFPDDRLFTFSIGGMRTFGELAMELLTMGEPMVRGLARNDWETTYDREPRPKEDILARWDEATRHIDELWAEIPPSRFRETVTAFGQWTGPAWSLMIYVIDNEIHHRGQGYVYLRALDIAPPPFYER